MSERYTKIFSISDNLYLDGAPLLIEAGALLKDNKNGEVLAQLKMRNLYHSLLNACKVHIRAFDPSGAELEGVEEFSYLDLQEAYGAEFGQKTAIPMPDKNTRRIKVLKIASNTKFNEKLEYLNDEWREKRNQLTHSLFNKDPDTVITEVKIMVKNGYEAVRIFDQAVSQLKKEKIRNQFKIK